MSLPTTYKPSPLSIGSPRTSPFRRPESPAAQLRPCTPTSPSSRASTPPTSPTKPHLTSPSKLQASSTPPPASLSAETTPRNLTPQALTSPSTRSTSSASTAIPLPRSGPINTTNNSNSNSGSISSLPPHMLNSMRSAFSTLDHSNTGCISRADVAATLGDLGLPNSSSDVAHFFPPGSPQSLPLAQFLGQLAGPLSQISREEELMNAFGAFDEKDCGELDAALLRDALMHTGGGGTDAMAESDVLRVFEGFVGRKAFGKGAGQGERGEVFRYREWVDEVIGKEKEGQLAVT